MFSDSIFGLGGVYRDGNDSMICTVYSTVIDGSPPDTEQRNFVSYPKTKETVCHNNNTFNRSTHPHTYSNKFFQKKMSPSLGKNLSLQTLYQYMSYLLNSCNTSKIKNSASRKLKSIWHSLKNIDEELVRRQILLAINSFYKNPRKNLTNYQFELLTKALKNPLKKGENEFETTSQLSKFKNLITRFPNCLLKDITVPTFYCTKVSEDSTKVKNNSDALCIEAAHMVMALILVTFEKLSDKRYPNSLVKDILGTLRHRTLSLIHI